MSVRRRQRIDLRDKKRLIHAYLAREDYLLLAEQLNIPLSTARGIVSRAIKTNDPENIEEGKRGGPTNTKVDDEMKEVIRDILSGNPAITLVNLNTELQRRLPNKPRVTAKHLGTICNGMFFTLKKLQAAPADRNRPDVKAQRKEYATWFLEDALCAPRVVYIDEAGFNVWTQRTRGRAPVGEPAVRTYVITGQIQSDAIESRFGRYRQMSGGNFFISVKQVLESESKIKLVSLLKNSNVLLSSIVEGEMSDVTPAEPFELHDFSEVDIAESELQVIFYVAGYCAHNLIKRISCEECKSFIICDSNLPNIDGPTKFFEILNRGGLKCPANEIFLLCCTAYQIFCKIKCSSHFDEFLRLPSPRDTFVSTVMNCYEQKENETIVRICKNNHNMYSIWRRVTSIFLTAWRETFCDLTRLMPMSKTLPEKYTNCVLRENNLHVFRV